MLTRILIAVLGAAVATIGAIAAIGYACNVGRFYGWIIDRQAMAVNTAISFVLVGIALTLIGCSDRLWNTDGQRCNSK